MENSDDFKELLNFLSLACKVNIDELPENSENLQNDLKSLVSCPLIFSVLNGVQNVNSEQYNMHPSAEKDQENFKSLRDCHCEDEQLNRIVTELKNRLTSLLNEGIFDSVLPYIEKDNGKEIKELRAHDKYSKIRPRAKKKKEKKMKNVESKSIVIEKSTEVEIHVYDEVKGIKKNFKCPQHILVSHMGYFLEISRGQKLEELDITVHCDIETFEWLLKWAKQNSNDSSYHEISPRLDFKNVIHIMVSADFLQMHPLFEDCLDFCKTNLNDVIKFSTNLQSLSDYILTKLADKLSNVEIQNLRDKKDKVKSKLFCKLITSLNEKEPLKRRGHFASSAYLYFCLRCHKLVTKTDASNVPCRVQYLSIKYNGDVIFNHARDPKWDINQHIKNIWSEYKNWSSTYWRLWSQCHFLYCYSCRAMYAVAFSDCCPYHPQQPHFYATDQSQNTINSPIGRYPCCGSKALRFETVMLQSGCKLRSHVPKLMSNEDTEIQTLIHSFPDLIKVKWSNNNISTFTEDYNSINFTFIFNNMFPDGEDLNLNLGLLKGPLYDTYIKTLQKYKTSSNWELKKKCVMPKVKDSYKHFEYSSLEENDDSDLSNHQDNSPFNGDGISVGGEENNQIDIHENNKNGPTWSSKYSIRHNQDNLRDSEEIAFRAMLSVLMDHQQKHQKSTTDKQAKNERNDLEVGGSYVKIESEWKEFRLKIMDNKCTQKM